MNDRLKIWTVGHSTRTLDEFRRLLSAFEIKVLADVRRFPGSRKYPHFNADALRISLTEIGVRYEPFTELGGRRRPSPDSHNTVWRNESFRGYADYMETDEFRSGIIRLTDTARTGRTAIMCAETLWWRCHRSLISDYLTSQGLEICHIFDQQKSELHRYTSAARIVDGRLTYSPIA
ncbi:MAG: DUF488 domain-containing protein [Acidobacteriota bacterium]